LVPAKTGGRDPQREPAQDAAILGASDMLTNLLLTAVGLALIVYGLYRLKLGVRQVKQFIARIKPKKEQ
jgi:hypothetical protein